MKPFRPFFMFKLSQLATSKVHKDGLTLHRKFAWIFCRLKKRQMLIDSSQNRF